MSIIFACAVSTAYAHDVERTQVLLSFARDGSFTLDVSNDPNWLKLRLPRYEGPFADRVVLFVDGREIRPSSVEFISGDTVATHRMRGRFPTDAKTLRWYYGMVADPYPLAVGAPDGERIGIGDHAVVPAQRFRVGRKAAAHPVRRDCISRNELHR